MAYRGEWPRLPLGSSCQKAPGSPEGWCCLAFVTGPDWRTPGPERVFARIDLYAEQKTSSSKSSTKSRGNNGDPATPTYPGSGVEGAAAERSPRRTTPPHGSLILRVLRTAPGLEQGPHKATGGGGAAESSGELPGAGYGANAGPQELRRRARSGATGEAGRGAGSAALRRWAAAEQPAGPEERQRGALRTRRRRQPGAAGPAGAARSGTERPGRAPTWRRGRGEGVRGAGGSAEPGAGGGDTH